MVLLFTGRAEMVTEYDNQLIRGVDKEFALPKILRLYGRHKSEKKVHFSRQNLFWRDKNRCQYCYQTFPSSKLTIDHVIPQSRDGSSEWDNLVTCCAPCNVTKGCKTPEEVHFKLYKRPVRPDWSPQLCLRLKKDDPAEWWEWLGPRVYKQMA
jgi:5-methylcytosine-specific restriction endonuclease McrA